MKRLIVVLVVLCSTTSLFAQDFKKELEKLSISNQKRLDTGRFMLDTERSYYIQMDSMLNVVYNHIRKSMNENEKSALKKIQLQWLKDRDVRFKEINQNDYGMGGGQDEAMVKYQKKSVYVIERVNYLIDNYLE